MQPMGTPARSLKLAMDFLARRIAGFWPVMISRSATAASSSLMLCSASPTPMLTTTFCIRGTCMTVV